MRMEMRPSRRSMVLHGIPESSGYSVYGSLKSYPKQNRKFVYLQVFSAHHPIQHLSVQAMPIQTLCGTLKKRCL